MKSSNDILFESHHLSRHSEREGCRQQRVGRAPVNRLKKFLIILLKNKNKKEINKDVTQRVNSEECLVEESRLAPAFSSPIWDLAAIRVVL